MDKETQLEKKRKELMNQHNGALNAHYRYKRQAKQAEKTMERISAQLLLLEDLSPSEDINVSK